MNWLEVPGDCPLEFQYKGGGRSIWITNEDPDRSVLSISLACSQPGSSVGPEAIRLTISVEEGYRLAGLPTPKNPRAIMGPRTTSFDSSQRYWEFYVSHCSSNGQLRVVSVEYLDHEGSWTDDALSEAHQPKLVEAVAPDYPKLAVYSAATGKVRVRVTLDEAGSVTMATAVEGHPLLVAPSEEAARRWRFAAGERGREVEVAFAYRILPMRTPPSELTPKYRAPFEIEVFGVIPEIPVDDRAPPTTSTTPDRANA